MLKKDQALAMMDAHIIRVEAERQQRLERRTSHLTRLYPALRDAPAEEREALVYGASRHALQRWTIYALGILTLAGVVAAFFLPDRATGATLLLRIGAVVLALQCTFSVVFYIRMRNAIAREVEARYGGVMNHLRHRSSRGG